MNPRSHLCHVCGFSFNRRYNFQRHMQNVHGEVDEDTDSEQSESESEDDDASSDVDMESANDLEDNPTYREWYQQALEDTQETRNQKYEKYVNDDGLNEEDAREKAHEKTLWLVKRIFFETYSTFLRHSLRVMEDEVHREIMSDLKDKTEDEGMDVERAVKKTLVQHRPKFEELFEYDDDDDDDVDDSDEEEKGSDKEEEMDEGSN